MFSYFDSLWQVNASGIVVSLWTLIWHWGLGVGLIILFIFLAYISPTNKSWFMGAAGIVFLGLIIYGYGQHDEKAVCDSRIKYIYLRAHPKITKKNIAKNWKVSPSWDPGKPPVYRPAKPVCDGPFDTRCWGQN